MPKYQNKDVQVVRPARAGDPGFQSGQDMVVIKGDDGQERAVARKDVKDAEAGGEKDQAQSQSQQTPEANQGERRGGPTQAQQS